MNSCHSQSLSEHVLQHHKQSVTGVRFNQAGNRLVTCDAKGEICLWDLRKLPPQPPASSTSGDGPLLRMLVCQTGRKSGASQPGSANAVVLDDTSACVAVACGDGIVRLIEVATEKVSINDGEVRKMMIHKMMLFVQKMFQINANPESHR
ncbi:unnamed protein product [Protopolystoma xenopodis]|uniref:Uncharacterized protein n=1 Tax=Protopolystoma xenopodis TaxID=117903 RepID=A0A3S5AWV0_9PLAT|nr:unnamed protein product [Protopolystoma xenopodis]